MTRPKIIAVVLLLATAVGLAFPAAALAASNMRGGDMTSIAKDEVVDATVYLAGSTITVAGQVKGDVYCAGQTIDITGTVEGDVFCAGQTVRVAGTVAGSVHVAGQTVTLSGPVARNASAFGQSVTLSETGSVNGDGTFFGSAVQLNGKVGRDVVAGGQSVSLGGSVIRNVTATADVVSLGKVARIGGDLVYTSHNNVSLSDGAVVNGRTQHDLPQPRRDEVVEKSFFATWLMGALYWFGALLVFGLVLLMVSPRSFRQTNIAMTTRGGWALLAGLTVLIMTPIVAVLCMVTVIGIPVGLALLFGWLVALVVSYVYSAHSIGAWLANRAGWKLKWPTASSLLLGLVLLMAVMIVPVLSGLFGFLALVWGLGGITLAIGEHLKTRTEQPRPAKRVVHE